MVRVLLELLELVYVLICVHQLYGKKLRVDLHSVVFILFASIVLDAVNRGMLPRSSPMFLYAGLYIYCIFEFGRYFAKALVNCILCIMIMSVFQLIFYFPTFMLIGELGNMSLERFIIHICCLAAIILLSKTVDLCTLSEYFLKREVALRVVSFITLVFFGIVLYQFKNLWTVSTGNYAFAIIFLVMIYVVVFQWQKARSEAEQRTAELKMQELCNSSFAELIAQVRMRQHDFNNHLNAILSMQHTSSSLEELKEKQNAYCEYICDENKFNRLLSSEGNLSMIGFLYSKFMEADKQGISVEYEVQIGTLESPAGVYGLMEAAGILIDNAAEAVLSQEEETEKIIRCCLKETEEKISLQIWSAGRRYSQDEMELFFRRGYSTKGSGRGLGLENVKRIMERGRGEISVENREYYGCNYLIFELMIPK